jgi:glucose-1-phosphate thymidylyltransferase
MEIRMKCLILAAGYATRLYPLTENFPKPLLDVQGKTILDWLIDDIDSLGLVDEYVVISNHKFAHHFDAWAKEKKQKITVVDDGTSTNETRLGAVCDIQFAIDKLSLDDEMLVIAGDNVLDFSLTEFIKYAREKGTSCIMRYFESDTKRLTKSGVVTVNEDDLVIDMVEKPATPPSNWCCPPFYFYTGADARLVKEGIASGCGTDAPGSYIAWLCHKTSVHAMEMPGKRFDIGNLESYEKVKKEYHGIC